MTRVTNIAQSRAYRSAIAIFGGYAFTAGFFAFLSVLLTLAGLNEAEALFWAILTSFLVYVLCVIWIAATERPRITTAIIIFGATAMIVLSPYLASQIAQA